MKTEESLKRELARLRKERTALSEQAVQDARSWERINTIGWKTKNVLNQLTEHFPGWKDDEDRIPHRDTDGQINTVRYEAVNAMLHDGFLKEHRNVAEQQSTIAELKTTVAQQQKQIQALTATVRRVSERVELRIPAPQIAANDD
jgi:uncharacterized coiled-coil protein SlyX